MFLNINLIYKFNPTLKFIGANLGNKGLEKWNATLYVSFVIYAVFNVAQRFGFGFLRFMGISGASINGYFRLLSGDQ